MKLIVPTDVTPAAGAWNDVDVTALVGADAGSVAFVLLDVYLKAWPQEWGVRRNGSADAFYERLPGHTYVAVPVDAGDIFECQVSSAVNVKVTMRGYATTAEAGVKTNMVDKSPATGAWRDVDISGDTGADTALVAFFQIEVSPAFVDWRVVGLRKNGSGDARETFMLFGSIHGAMMAVDGAEILECYRDNADAKLFLSCWLKANADSWANGKDYSTGVTGAYQDVDTSADTPAGSTGAFYEVYYGGGADRSYHVRKNGDADDNYLAGFSCSERHSYIWAGLDATRKGEQKIEDTDLDLWLWGDTNAPSAGGGTPKGGLNAAKMVAAGLL